MQHVLAKVVLVVALVTGFNAAAQVSAADNHTRQFFGSWHKHPKGFSYRPYYYKPHQQFVGFKHHYVIHFQQRPHHNYFYNPYKQQFWGRCPTETNGEASYSLLAERDRGGDINKIAESAFPKPGKMPPIHRRRNARPAAG
jgi:hypothetical protein